MRVLNRTEFLKMPAGTLFCKATERWAFDGLQVKWQTLEPNDFVAQSFDWVDAPDSETAVDRLDAMADEGASFPIETASGRDGLFEADALFLVMERDDLREIRRVIDVALEAADAR